MNLHFNLWTRVRHNFEAIIGTFSLKLIHGHLCWVHSWYSLWSGWLSDSFVVVCNILRWKNETFFFPLKRLKSRFTYSSITLHLYIFSACCMPAATLVNSLIRSVPVQQEQWTLWYCASLLIDFFSDTVSFRTWWPITNMSFVVCPQVRKM